MNETALHLAVKKGNLEIIKILLENSKNAAEIMDSNQHTPIEITNNDEIIKLFEKMKEVK